MSLSLEFNSRLSFESDASSCVIKSHHNLRKIFLIFESFSSSSPFGLFFQSGVATAYHHSPNLSVFNIRLFPISSFTTSKNRLFGLPLLHFPGNSISIIFLLTYSWSLLMTCPYHLILPSLIFIPNHSTLSVPLMYSFMILSFLVTPIANLNIFISATSISFTCFFVTATVSSPYTITGLTTELYTFPFTLAGNLLSQITPDILLHPFHPACTLFFTSLSQPPLSCTVDPKYLNSFTLGTFVSSIYTVSSSFPPFMHRYSVFDLLIFIPLLSNAYLQDSNHRSTSSIVFSKITISPAKSIVHGGPFLTSSVSLSIITANRNGLNADPWCSPTLTLKLSVVPTAHLTTVSLPSHISLPPVTASKAGYAVLKTAFLRDRSWLPSYLTSISTICLP